MKLVVPTYVLVMVICPRFWWIAAVTSAVALILTAKPIVEEIIAAVRREL